MSENLTLPKAVKDKWLWKYYTMGEYSIYKHDEFWVVNSEAHRNIYFEAETFTDAKTFVRTVLQYEYLQDKYPKFNI